MLTIVVKERTTCSAYGCCLTNRGLAESILYLDTKRDSPLNRHLMRCGNSYGRGTLLPLRIKINPAGDIMDKILICDDEKDIVTAIRIYLETTGYETVCCYNGQEALDALRTDEDIHLVLLDLMMPVMDGYACMREIRKISNVPVILLTAKSEDTDKIEGLTLGADDYVTKPFNPMELLARVKSSLRRYTLLGGVNGQPEEQDANVLSCGAISIHDDSKEVFVDGEKVALTPTEYNILKFLVEHPGAVYSPKEIYREVWHDAAFEAENTVAVHVRHLREKIEINPSEPRYLKVVWGRGYKLEKA